MEYVKIKEKLLIDLSFYISLDDGNVKYNLSTLITMIYGLYKFGFINQDEYTELHNIITDKLFEHFREQKCIFNSDK